MPEFSITRQIDAPVERVWDVLQDFGSISQWNPGVKKSHLTSEGPVVEGSTRHCTFAPFGSVNERVARHEHHERFTVHIYEAFKLPIKEAKADFNVVEKDGGTELNLHYSYTPNLLGRITKGLTNKKMRQGIGGLAKSLQRESERIAAGWRRDGNPALCPTDSEKRGQGQPDQLDDPPCHVEAGKANEDHEQDRPALLIGVTRGALRACADEAFVAHTSLILAGLRAADRRRSCPCVRRNAAG